MTDESPIDPTTTGMDRRSLLKRGAVVGGALVWTTPIVQSIASPAFADHSVIDPDEVCPPDTSLFFKYNVQGGFSNGIPAENSTAGSCIPDDVVKGVTTSLASDGALPGTELHVSVTFNIVGGTATVFVPTGYVLASATLKVGQGANTGICIEAISSSTPVFEGGVQIGTAYTLTESVPQSISFVSGVIECAPS